MPDGLPLLPTSRNPYEPVQSGVEVPPHIGTPNHEVWSNGHPTSTDLDVAYTTMSHGNYDPRVRYSHNTWRDELPHPVSVHAGHRENQCYSGGYPTGGITQYIPVASSLARPEYHAPVAPVPNDGPPGQGPLLHLVAGSIEGNLNPVHLGMSATEDLKRAASRYLCSPGSRVDKLRMRRSRSGGFKVLIMLEIEDAM